MLYFAAYKTRQKTKFLIILCKYYEISCSRCLTVCDRNRQVTHKEEQSYLFFLFFVTWNRIWQFWSVAVSYCKCGKPFSIFVSIANVFKLESTTCELYIVNVDLNQNQSFHSDERIKCTRYWFHKNTALYFVF